MTEKGRNLAVGLTVLVGLVMFAALVVILTGLPGRLGGGQTVTVLSPATQGIRSGDTVRMLDLRIGTVKSVDFTEPGNLSKGVTMTLSIDSGIVLPANAKAVIIKGSGFQGAYVAINAEGPLPTDADGKTIVNLPMSPPPVLTARVEGGSMFPPEMIDAVKSIQKLADNVSVLVCAPESPSSDTQAATATAGGATTQPAQPCLTDTLARVNRALDAFSAVFGAEDNQAHIRQALADVAKASAGANEAMASLKSFAASADRAAVKAEQTVEQFGKVGAQAGQDLHAISQKLIDNAEKISQLTMTLNRVVMKIESGEGSAGKLMNDPKLYNSVVDVAEGLNRLTRDISAMVERWKEDGIPMKLK